MNVTELRDQQNADWHAWASRDPDRAREHNRRRRDELDELTSSSPVRLCEYVSPSQVPCMRKHYGKGLCSGHWQQIRRGRELSPLIEDVVPRKCDYEGCDEPHYGRGWCRAHWMQGRRGGTLRPLSRRPTLNAAPPGSRNGEPWAEWEFDLVMSDTPLREVALRLGRTYSSVVRARQRRRKMLGLDITRIKTEADPYDGSDRAGVLIEKEK